MKKTKLTKGEELFNIWRKTEELYRRSGQGKTYKVPDIYIAMEAVGIILNKYLIKLNIFKQSAGRPSWVGQKSKNLRAHCKANEHKKAFL